MKRPLMLSRSTLIPSSPRALSTSAGIMLLLGLVAGCGSPATYRAEADRVALDIIAKKQKEVLGKSEPFGIERPSEILRRRLLRDHNLPHAGEASFGTDKLTPVEHWPEENYPPDAESSDLGVTVPSDVPLSLSLVQALQVGARNSFDYQTRKEGIFQAALRLDLEMDAFRNTFDGQMEILASQDGSGTDTLKGLENDGSFGAERTFENGINLNTALAVGFANLLSPDKASSFGPMADASISIPLLRGSGAHIVMESLTQAERDVVYAIYGFERFKREFAVDVARVYLGVVRQLDSAKNAEENYRRLIASARRSRRLANAGRTPEIEVDQTVQSELRARDRWISAQQSYKRQLDSFKVLLGLPGDARVELDTEDIKLLVKPADNLIMETSGEPGEKEGEGIDLVPPDRKNAGPLELEEVDAIRLALENRMDMKVAMGEVVDAQRGVVVAADALGPELTLFGSADLGGSRSISSATSDDARLKTREGIYTSWLTIDLPFERTAERNDYRNSLIELEQQVREVQKLEDQIKLSIRNKLRDLLQARESLRIQAKSVAVAKKRVKSTNLFLEAGRAQMRDLLEAQDSLLAAQNDLTSAVINYRVAELEIQRDMGVLEVDGSGLWREYKPGEPESEE